MTFLANNLPTHADVIDEVHRLAADNTAGVATTAETSTGTSAVLGVTPDGLAGSIYGQKEIALVLFNSGTATATGDGVVPFVVSMTMNGMNLVTATASTYTAGVTGQTTVQVRRSRGGTDVDMLTTKMIIATTAYTNSTTDVDVANDDVNVGDMIFIDCDEICSGTAANGLAVTLCFATP